MNIRSVWTRIVDLPYRVNAWLHMPAHVEAPVRTREYGKHSDTRGLDDVVVPVGELLAKFGRGPLEDIATHSKPEEEVSAA